MENSNIQSNGIHDIEAVRERWRRIELPPGVFFMPTDEELIGVYLRSRAAVAGVSTLRGLDMPTYEIYVPRADPWVIRREAAFPYCKNGEVYCFTRRRRRGVRASGSGSWVAIGNEVPVFAERTGELLGFKLILEFVPEGGVDPDHDDEHSNWFMHEYRLPAGRGGRPAPSSSLAHELVLCKIFQQRDEHDEDEREEEEDDDDEEEEEELPGSSDQETSSITVSD